MKNAFGINLIRIRLRRESIPILPLVLELSITAVGVPTVNKDNNQHRPNENLRLGNYREGIKTMIVILVEKLKCLKINWKTIDACTLFCRLIFNQKDMCCT